MDFYDLDLEDCVFDALDAMKFKQCTPVQEQSIPIILEGHDLIAVAQTGTGKTAAYLLPVISELCRYSYPEHAINCVVMSPTRELAQQIDQQLEGFSYYNDLTSIAIYGGNDGDKRKAQQPHADKPRDLFPIQEQPPPSDAIRPVGQKMHAMTDKTLKC